MKKDDDVQHEKAQKDELQKKLWEMANTLRSNMDGADFKYYVLGLLFYRQLSEHIETKAAELLSGEKCSFEEAFHNDQLRQVLTEAVLESSGYFIEPQYLFKVCIDQIEKNEFTVEYLQKALNSISASSEGQPSQHAFEDLFADMDLTSAKLGANVKDRSKLIGRLMQSIDAIDFHLNDSRIDVLGDTYEYLIGMYAASAGKKAGEFYTPQNVSKLLARLSTSGLTKVKSVSDCTCGSGSLLIQVGNYVKAGHYYGNEVNPTTYNLARMNMILHNIPYQYFDIRRMDTVRDGGKEEYEGERFSVQVANPPYSQKWSAASHYLEDDRFSPYGALAPKSYEDLAFLEHMIYHMDKKDARIAVLMPHGVLFRGGAEEKIRTYIIEKLNYLDAVIGLPPGCFYGTTIPVSLLVLKNERSVNSGNVLFIDASKEFEDGKSQNYLSDANVDKIVTAYTNRKDEKKFCHVAPLKEIQDNNYNLNITRYVDTFEEEPPVDLAAVEKDLNAAYKERDGLMKKYDAYAKELGL
jgi:type I restriction enzyme M protein